MNRILPRAETFILKSARLLERRRFAFHFRGGPKEVVLATGLTLKAYGRLET